MHGGHGGVADCRKIYRCKMYVCGSESYCAIMTLFSVESSCNFFFLQMAAFEGHVQNSSSSVWVLECDLV